MSCPKCRGFMVQERADDRLSAYGGTVLHRCVSCGELLDAVILQNRERHHDAAGAPRHYPARAV